LFSCLVKHAGDLSQALAQSLPYLLGAGVQLGGLASIKVCGNETVKADLILIERKHSLHHQFSEQPKAAQNGVLIENFGNFSLKILGIFVPYIIEDMDSRFHR
jgi:hypothetical protein